MKNLPAPSHPEPTDNPRSDAGFSLIEVVIALLIVMIGLLSVAAVFTFAINQNAGNKSRSQALTILQEAAEQIRSAKFNGATTDAVLLGGTRPQEVRTAENGNTFLLDVTVDNEPLVDGTQDEDYECLSPQDVVIPCTLKEISVTVSFAAPTPGWQTAVPSVVRIRRVRGN
jgi:type II secretory pathway pseudopilin PulG